MSIEDLKIERTLEVGEERNVDFWLRKTPQERCAGIEALRQMFYGYDPTTARVQRVLEIVEREQR
jgi:hypothetical protein